MARKPVFTAIVRRDNHRQSLVHAMKDLFMAPLFLGSRFGPASVGRVGCWRGRRCTFGRVPNRIADQIAEQATEQHEVGPNGDVARFEGDR